MSRPWQVIARREIRAKVKEKSFRIGAISTAVLIVFGLTVLAFLSGRSTTHTVAVVDPAAVQVVSTADQLLGATGAAPAAGFVVDGGEPDRIEAVTVADEAAARQAVLAGSVDVAVVPGPDGVGRDLIAERAVDPVLEQALSAAIAQEGTSAVLDLAGVDPATLAEAGGARLVLLNPDSHDEGVLFALKFVFSFMFVSALLTFGLSIAQAVVQEKESRVVEILAAAVPVRDMLGGKIVANFVLGTAQVLVMTTLAIGGLRLIDVLPDLGAVVAAGSWFVIFFVLGFLAMACVWAALGAMATKVDDLASSAVPMQAVLFAGYLAAFLAPDWLLRITSYLPVLSSVTMPTRILTGDVLWWEPVVAALLVAGFGLLAMRFGVAVHRRSLLRTARRVTFSDVVTGRVGTG